MKVKNNVKQEDSEGVWIVNQSDKEYFKILELKVNNLKKEVKKKSY